MFLHTESASFNVLQNNILETKTSKKISVEEHLVKKKVKKMANNKQFVVAGLELIRINM